MINIIRQWPSGRKVMKHGLGLVGAESIMVPSRPWSHGHHPQVWQLDDIGFTTWFIGIHCMGGINIYHFYSGWWWLMVNITGWWFQRWLLFSISLIWDVIPTPLTNSIIFQRGRSITNQLIRVSLKLGEGSLPNRGHHGGRWWSTLGFGSCFPLQSRVLVVFAPQNKNIVKSKHR